MQNIEVKLKNEPGQLALFGETLGRHHISLEGGGVFRTSGLSIANFLVEDGSKARAALRSVGIEVLAVQKVLVVKLRQDVPGQLGLFCRRLYNAGVNIEVQYSDHANHLIVVPDNFYKGRQVVKHWMKEWWPQLSEWE